MSENPIHDPDPRYSELIVLYRTLEAENERLREALAGLTEATRRLIRNVNTENFNRPARAETSSGLRIALRDAGEAIGAGRAALAPPCEGGEEGDRASAHGGTSLIR